MELVQWKPNKNTNGLYIFTYIIPVDLDAMTMNPECIHLPQIHVPKTNLLWGPGCVSQDLAQSTLPNAPDLTICSAFFKTLAYNFKSSRYPAKCQHLLNFHHSKCFLRIPTRGLGTHDILLCFYA